MTPTKQTVSEADRVELVYSYVLSQIGAQTVAELLALWQSIPAGKAAQTATSWLSRATDLILTRRREARDLGLAYYRLNRALRTGSTIRNPVSNEPDLKTISLEKLRQDFEALVAKHTGDGSPDVTASHEPYGNDDSIEVEDLDNLAKDLASDEAASPAYAKQLLEDMGTTATQAVDNLPDTMSNADAKASAKELHLQHGAMVAAAAARVAMNGGRNATNQASSRDRRVIGWVRQSKTGTPCYFCAMLISRRILYRSEFTAGKGSRLDGRSFLGSGLFKFHDNCHCIAVEVYSDTDFMTNPKYAENRKYGDLWDSHIKGKFGGAEAMQQWRNLITRQRANENKNSAAAQAAA